jgi:hypothetical protein|tara:strand:+ start:59 stop:292 length:234 start_codon:yes stop_codon:yes gene_type:complete
MMEKIMTVEEIYREFEKLTADLCADGANDPLSCAGIMMAQAMTIYKTALNENEFNIMTETILKSRSDVIEFESPTLN